MVLVFLFFPIKVHIFSILEHFLLENPDWKYDQIPEIMDGKNIGDYVDADILEKL